MLRRFYKGRAANVIAMLLLCNKNNGVTTFRGLFGRKSRNYMTKRHKGETLDDNVHTKIIQKGLMTADY
jgi:hypothetical protein